MSDAPKYRLEAAMAGVKRVMDGEKILGFAMHLSNSRWGAFSTDDQPLTASTFQTPVGVRKWFESRDIVKCR